MLVSGCRQQNVRPRPYESAVGNVTRIDRRRRRRGYMEVRRQMRENGKVDLDHACIYHGHESGNAAALDPPLWC